jgi:hypothetical protein
MKNAGKILVGAVFIAGGCSLFSACGSTAANPTTDDGGTKDASLASETSTVDSFVPEASADGATCDLSADLTKEIPDAALDEAGTKSTGLCLACANKASTCKAQIDACNGDCDCKGIAGDVLVCIAKGGSQIACASMAASLPPAAQQIGIGLLQCVQANCAAECTPAGLTDAGVKDAGQDADAGVN